MASSVTPHGAVQITSTNPPKAQSGPDRYVQLDSHIGQGTFGKVEKARDTLDNSIVAIKKVKVEHTIPEDISTTTVAGCGIHWTVLREIRIMTELNHKNIISIKDVYVEGDFISLVMPHMTCDLRKLLEKRVALTEAQIKLIFLQITKGLAELHRNWFVHRDLAPANIFINTEGVCKIGDFGLSRSFGSPRGYKKTPKVVTLWYRPPELLYGANQYQDRVDTWSLGCIFAELLSGGKPLFPGQGEIDQLAKIFELCGTPDDTNWPEAKQLPLFFEFTHTPPADFRLRFPVVSKTALDLLQQLLTLSPAKRISSTEALKHSYFASLPAPCQPSELPLHHFQ